MFKKYFVYFYLTFISFIAGMLFIIQCGGSNIVDALSDILGTDISYDSSSSGMTATTLQGAIDELHTSLQEVALAIPFVYDSTGKKVGSFIHVAYEDTERWMMWDTQTQAPFYVDPGQGEVTRDDFWAMGGMASEAESTSTYLYYTEDDCGGSPYGNWSYFFENDGTLPAVGDTWNPMPFYLNGQFYWYKLNGQVTSTAAIRSYKLAYLTTETCSNIESSSALSAVITDGSGAGYEAVFVEMEAIQEPSYTGPLFLKGGL